MTRAILIAGQGAGALFGSPIPDCLDLLVDRPFLHHLIEQIANQGIRRIDVLIGAGAHRIGAELGGGERWGVAIRCHATPRESVYAALARVDRLPEDADVLFAHADVLVAPGCWNRAGPERAPLELYYFDPASGRDAEPEWTGWCRGDGQLFAASAAVRTQDELLGRLAAHARPAARRTGAALGFRSAAELLGSNQRVLSGRAPFIAPRGRRGPGGVWTERGVRVHPTATFEGCVYLGEQAEVGPEATLGPSVVVGAGCVLDARVTVRDCVIPAATYVGPDTRLERIVGLESGRFLGSTGRAVEEPLAGALVDMRRVSSAAALKLWGKQCLSWLAALALAPLWLLPHLVNLVLGRVTLAESVGSEPN